MIHLSAIFLAVVIIQLAISGGYADTVTITGMAIASKEMILQGRIQSHPSISLVAKILNLQTNRGLVMSDRKITRGFKGEGRLVIRVSKAGENPQILRLMGEKFIKVPLDILRSLGKLQKWYRVKE